MCKDIRWSIYKRKDTSQHVILHNLTLQSIALHREMITYTFIRPCNYRYGNVQSSFVWICVTIENTWRIHSDARGRWPVRQCLFVRGCTLHGQSFHDGLAEIGKFTTPKPRGGNPVTFKSLILIFSKSAVENMACLTRQQNISPEVEMRLRSH